MISRAVPVPQTGNVDLIQWLDRKVKHMSQTVEADKQRLTQRDANVRELSLCEQLLADDFERIVRLEAQLANWDAELNNHACLAKLVPISDSVF